MHRVPNPLADCDGEGRAESAARGASAGCNGCAASGHVGAVRARCTLGAGGTACGGAGGSGGGGGRAAGSAGLGSSGSGGRGAGSALRVRLVLCGAGWSGGVCGI